ncbi:ankyrin repeat domain-containing protein [Jannaschia sp. KMU-145]|uniref:ankyrin repeat domain-containing protein n=1 Tax=Jannaschia halovivens TaxID=3388667 RepID=UPI00396B3FFF
MRIFCAAALIGLTAAEAAAQSREGLCDLVAIEIADEAEVHRLLAPGENHFVRCYEGYTPLHVAVSANNLLAIQILADAGSDLDARNDFGSTPLHVAILASSAGAVELLLDLGADIHSFGPDAMSPLAFARKWGEAEIVSILVARGARM